MHHDIEHLLAQPFGSLPELIAQQAAHRPRHTALVLGTQSLDYAALRAGMDRVACSLQQSARKAMQTPDVRQRFAELGGVPGGETPAEYDAFIAQERKSWAQIVKAAGLSLE